MDSGMTYSSLFNLVLNNRSYRRFDNTFPVSKETLRELVGLARLTSSSKNRQPLKYILVTEEEECAFVFHRLKWAWHLRDWDGPSPYERPAAYLIMLLDKRLNERADFDAGISAQTILLGAVEKNLGGCIIRTCNRYELGKFFQLPEDLEIIMVIALGKPAEHVVLDDEDTTGKMEYYRDVQNVHHVPKRTVDELIYKPTRNDQD